MRIMKGKVTTSSVWVIQSLLLLLSIGFTASMAAESSDYAYPTQARDTLIGLSKRLLKNPQQWPALQQRNAIADPTHIPIGTIILIPRDWLRQESEAAQVTAVVGEATSDNVALKVGDKLSQGANINTGGSGYLTITLQDGSLVTINPASKALLEKLQRYQGTGLRDTQLKLDAGSVETKVKPQGDAGRFQIRTPVAISAVRGTEFRRAFNVADSLDRTEVTGGAVAVDGSKAGVVVPAGFGTISDSSGTPHQPVKLLVPPDLSALPSRFDDSMIHIQFSAVAGAQHYRVQLATESLFQLVTADRVVDVSDVEFTDVPDGHYWLRVRSVDTNGLEGDDSIREFDRSKRLPPPPQKEPGTDAFVTGNGTTFVWSNTDGAKSYHFQLAKSDSFDEIAIDRVTVESTRFDVESVAPGSYYWRVSAMDATGNAGSWSNPQHFLQKPPAPTIAEPVIEKKSITISWNGDATQRFHVQVATDADFKHIVDERQADATHVDLKRHSTGTHFVRVQAIDADGYIGPYSSSRRFSVPAPWWVIISPVILVIPFL